MKRSGPQPIARRRWRQLCLASVAWFGAACAPLAPRPALLADDLMVGSVPFHAQREHACGPAALSMLLGAAGTAVAPDALTPLLVIPEREGTLQAEMLAQARHHGFIAQQISADIAALAAELHRGRPVLVLQNNGLAWYPIWHYAVVVGYDAAADAMVLDSGVTEHMRLSRATFERTWARSGRWGFVLLAPGETPVGASADAYARAVAAFEQGAEPAAARRAWQAGRAAWPQRWEFAFGLGNRDHADGDLDGAALAFGAATALDPAQAAAWNNLAVVLMDLARWDEALEAAATAARLSPDPEVAATLREARCRRGCADPR